MFLNFAIKFLPLFFSFLYLKILWNIKPLIQSCYQTATKIMDFNNLKIGYVPYLPDLSQPGDRRRFPYFAKRNNVPYEVADTNKSYDLILLTAPSNLSQWLIYKKKHPETRFIFEMVDSLIFHGDIISTLFKGIGRFIKQRETVLYLDHKRLIKKWLKEADLVLCSSTELKKNIEKWNKNVMVSLDYMENEYKFLKTDYSINDKMKLVWEGMGVVLPHFLHFKELFKRIAPFCELHIITSEKYPSYIKIFYSNVAKILKQLPITTIYHKWDLSTNNKVFEQCDCGIIPLDRKNRFGWHKPANKLVSFWYAGIPTVVSATPAYTEMMNNAGENLYCLTIDEWVAKIQQIKAMNPQEREALARKNFDFVSNNYSDEELDKGWYQAFEKIV